MSKITLRMDGAAVAKTEQGDEIIQVAFMPVYMSFSEYKSLVEVFEAHNNAISLDLPN